MTYNFEWDPKKANSNKVKHGISFDQACTIFRDPRAITIYDDTHSEKEDRWITLGISSGTGLLVVHHTFNQINNDTIDIRIISCRKALKKEIRQYQEE